VISIADASGSSRDVAGRDLLVTLPVPAGKITLTLASGTRATLLSPRLRAR
jgi:hypothetical protein